MDKIRQRINRLSKLDNKTIQEKCIKIQEEVGELSAEILKLHGKKGSNGLNKKQIEDNILEECCDIIIVTHSLLHKMAYSRNRIKNAFNRKLDKASLNIQKQKMWKRQLK